MQRCLPLPPPRPPLDPAPSLRGLPALPFSACRCLQLPLMRTLVSFPSLSSFPILVGAEVGPVRQRSARFAFALHRPYTFDNVLFLPIGCQKNSRSFAKVCSDCTLFDEFVSALKYTGLEARTNVRRCTAGISRGQPASGLKGLRLSAGGFAPAARARSQVLSFLRPRVKKNFSPII
jgi:hypothetical protein